VPVAASRARGVNFEGLLSKGRDDTDFVPRHQAEFRALAGPSDAAIGGCVVRNEGFADLRIRGNLARRREVGQCDTSGAHARLGRDPPRAATDNLCMPMVAVAQLVRAPDCGSGGRRFKSGQPPLTNSPEIPQKPGVPGFSIALSRTGNMFRFDLFCAQNAHKVRTRLRRVGDDRSWRPIWLLGG
jgi:hypothetical protein